MKLKEGMYVRTKQGTIEKVIKRYDTPSGCKIEVNEDFRFKHYEHSYIKHIKNASHNIIDLIEEGDYVNGCLVLDFETLQNREKAIIVNALDSYGWGQGVIPVHEIKSIVTKEQLDSIKYEVE